VIQILRLINPQDGLLLHFGEWAEFLIQQQKQHFFLALFNSLFNSLLFINRDLFLDLFILVI